MNEDVNRVAEKLWDESQSYAAEASVFLVSDFPPEENRQEIQKACIALQINFLFPNLNDSDRALLQMLGRASIAFQKGANVDRCAIHEEDRKGVESVTDEAEQVFMSLERRVKKELSPRLTLAQKIILESKFFKLFKD